MTQGSGPSGQADVESSLSSRSVVSGDLFNGGHDLIVNPVNCVGVLGAGLALEFRRRYPDYARAYQAACRAGEVQLGDVHVYERVGVGDPRWIVSFPTKQHWRDHSRLDDVVAGLDVLVGVVSALCPRSVGVPALGCGLGGLDWVVVRPVLVGALQRIGGAEVRIYRPGRG